MYKYNEGESDISPLSISVCVHNVDESFVRSKHINTTMKTVPDISFFWEEKMPNCIMIATIVDPAKLAKPTHTQEAREKFLLCVCVEVKSALAIILT